MSMGANARKRVVKQFMPLTASNGGNQKYGPWPGKTRTAIYTNGNKLLAICFEKKSK